ncbi:MAG: J domain-containing protein [Pseudomonadota bacterium]
MKLQSKYFDSIRVNKKGPGTAAKAKRAATRTCDWKDCQRPAAHRAPRGQGRENEFFYFCSEHIREFNANYNYFEGMSDVEIADFRAGEPTGHRPTWSAGTNGKAKSKAANTSAFGPGKVKGRTKPGLNGDAEAAREGGASDPHGFFEYRKRAAEQAAANAKRPVKRLEKKALTTLGLADRATGDEIKARYKELVKLHHPDTNGGDRASEDKLREIIQAYNHLKQAGLSG